MNVPRRTKIFSFGKNIATKTIVKMDTDSELNPLEHEKRWTIGWKASLTERPDTDGSMLVSITYSPVYGLRSEYLHRIKKAITERPCYICKRDMDDYEMPDEDSEKDIFFWEADKVIKHAVCHKFCFNSEVLDEARKQYEDGKMTVLVNDAMGYLRLYNQ
jgi:hypothetical protein